MTAKLPTRQLGKDGPEVTAPGFGLMGLSAFYGAVGSDEERFKLLDAAYEMGENNWDSSDIYADSEDLVGKWFKRTGKRNEIFIATKFGIVMSDGGRGTRGDPEYVKQACNKSLKRLGIDCIDLYYCHRLDQETPVEETVKAMVELKNTLTQPTISEGKIKYLGLSECSARSLRRAHAVHPITAIQTEYSPFEISIESDEVNLLRTCRELGVSVIAYSPLGRGMLTGAYKSPDDFEEGDFRKHAPRFSKENFPKNLELAGKIAELATKKGVTPGQLSLAWLMSQGKDVVPIPGTKKLKYLEENVRAIKVVLSKEEGGEIRKAVEGAEVHGVRYPEGMMGTLYADTPELKA
ncbi:uncharacterized protein KY384_006790 [Bacidia gigantensis]|uniref:uncharacterized protein n=1 Tax=Bacidia gigantensis TaxID=2732470 RepID=UPI001D0489CD|nr:uncharacterized protein KY384_006790 [Bacidia gigantensis]KAG8527874.1 hypothetical protein KY384_006790 [Bacidia gigantensis]